MRFYPTPDGPGYGHLRKVRGQALRDESGRITTSLDGMNGVGAG